jgi:hypothetical protein
MSEVSNEYSMKESGIALYPDALSTGSTASREHRLVFYAHVNLVANYFRHAKGFRLRLRNVLNIS